MLDKEMAKNIAKYELFLSSFIRTKAAIETTQAAPVAESRAAAEDTTNGR